jgi:hypothetical protein
MTIQQILHMFIKWCSLQKLWVTLVLNGIMRSTLWPGMICVVMFYHLPMVIARTNDYKKCTEIRNNLMACTIKMTNINDDHH